MKTMKDESNGLAKVALSVLTICAGVCAAAYFMAHLCDRLISFKKSEGLTLDSTDENDDEIEVEVENGN